MPGGQTQGQLAIVSEYKIWERLQAIILNYLHLYGSPAQGWIGLQKVGNLYRNDMYLVNATGGMQQLGKICSNVNLQCIVHFTI